MALHPVILAGGSGTRLWPLSRESYPKQLLPLMGERTMLQETLLRLDGLDGVARSVIVCNESHRFLVMEQVGQVDARPQAVIVEPVGRGTAPALTLASLWLSGAAPESGGDPVLLVMPADHAIGDAVALVSAVRVGARLAESGSMVTFGVSPRGPETRYGYIRKGEALEALESSASDQPAPPSGGRPRGYRISEFVEKPDGDTARGYLATGQYLWNSGIFMMRASVWLSELERLRPDILEACRAAHSRGRLDGVLYRPGADELAACPLETIDYAVMENVGDAARPPAASYAVVPLDAGWSDIGAWSSLWEEQERDSRGNVVQGDVYLHSTEDALLIARDRLLAIVGLKDIVVVETADAVLVTHRDRAGDVKDIVERLKSDGRAESESHRKVHRPWGWYEVLDAGEGVQVKRLTVNAGAATSLQMHHHRAEHWVVVRGTAKVTRGEEELTLSENESTFIELGMTHRLANPGDGPMEIIEVQLGGYLGEDDIVRFQDDYNRHKDL